MGRGHPPDTLPFVTPSFFPAGFPPTKRPLPGVCFVSGTALPCARFSTFRQGLLARGAFLGERSPPLGYSPFCDPSLPPSGNGGAIIPPYSSFRGSAPSSAVFLRDQAAPLPGPATCNKSSTAVDFWRPALFRRSSSGGWRALASNHPARQPCPVFRGFWG